MQTPEVRRPSAPQRGQVFQKLGSGMAQWPHKGTSRVPARTVAD